MAPRSVTFLGPQRLAPTLVDVVDALGVTGRVAAVTAGWEEREDEDQELSDHLRGRTVNLAVYRRGEDVFRRDPELLEAMRARHDRLRALQELYRQRLSHALTAARELLAQDGDPALLQPEREDAIEAVRRLDAHHLQRVREVHAEFQERWRPVERDAVAAHRRELAGLLGDAEALCVAGGHVAILLNRVRLFGLMELAGARPVVAWSAGAMALSDRVVLFHDSPPQGPGDAEVLEAGLGVGPGVVPLPHARRRLRLDDPTRVGLFARRFGPAQCLALDERAHALWDGARWSGEAPTRRLCEDGSVVEGVVG